MGIKSVWHVSKTFISTIYLKQLVRWVNISTRAECKRQTLHIARIVNMATLSEDQLDH